jgi:hypothetical protein
MKMRIERGEARVEMRITIRPLGVEEILEASPLLDVPIPGLILVADLRAREM